MPHNTQFELDSWTCNQSEEFDLWHWPQSSHVCEGIILKSDLRQAGLVNQNPSFSDPHPHPTSRHTKLMQRRGCRVPTVMTNWHVHPNIWALPSVPLLLSLQNQYITASYTWRRQNKWRGGRCLLTTSNKVGRNGSLIICFKAQWETREGASCSRAALHCMTQVLSFFSSLRASFLSVRLWRGANVLCEKCPCSSV